MDRRANMSVYTSFLLCGDSERIRDRDVRIHLLACNVHSASSTKRQLGTVRLQIKITDDPHKSTRVPFPVILGPNCVLSLPCSLLTSANKDAQQIAYTLPPGRTWHYTISTSSIASVFYLTFKTELRIRSLVPSFFHLIILSPFCCRMDWECSLTWCAFWSLASVGQCVLPILVTTSSCCSFPFVLLNCSCVQVPVQNAQNETSIIIIIG